MTSSVKKLLIEGLHDKRDVEIEFHNPMSIFVGPNGIGKSTILNIFVHFLSRQWQRLSKQPFRRVTIEFQSGQIATVTRRDCVDLISSDLPPRIQQMAAAISDTGMFDSLFDTSLTEEQLSSLSVSAGLAARDVRVVRNQLFHSGDSIRSLGVFAETSRTIEANFNRSILYLPTYRRIEQEIGEVLALAPAMARRVQAELTESVSHSPGVYTELVRFGMEDIKQLVDQYTSDIKEYSRQQINSLSTRYLIAALRVRQNFEKDFFDKLTDTRIKDVLARVDDEELNASQRRGITDLLKSLRDRQGAGRLSRAQEHISSYFYMLAETHDRISAREIALNRLARVLNEYMGPDKNASYDQTRYQFVVRSEGSEVPLSGLSSGEKQLVSLFSTLALSTDREYFVVIDEPELSLSVLWQEKLLSDIFSLEACFDIIAVTHSPFIYGETLAKYTRDVSDHIRPTQKI